MARSLDRNVQSGIKLGSINGEKWTWICSEFALKGASGIAINVDILFLERLALLLE